jgi:murein DD-endopeptidase MepM/ murein hydrolase activator NlpD
LVHVVNRGDAVLSIARRNHVSIAELAKANDLDRSAKLKLGMKLTVPGAKSAQRATASASPTTKLATVTPKPQEKTQLAQATTTPAKLSAETPVKATEATGALPTFHWPVRGKVITSYGAKTNGKANEGINLSVPEGTPVRAGRGRRRRLFRQ